MSEAREATITSVEYVQQLSGDENAPSVFVTDRSKPLAISVTSERARFLSCTSSEFLRVHENPGRTRS